MKADILPVSEDYCSPLGAVADAELNTLVADPDLRDDLVDTAQQAEYARIRRGDDLESGAAARRAVEEIGCMTCMLSDVCIVNDYFQDKITQGEEHETFMDAATMLASAPRWLNAARFHRSGLDGRNMLEKLTKGSEAQRLEVAASVSLSDLIGDTKNTFDGERTKADIPAINTMQVIDPKAQLPTHDITTKNMTYTVTDASEAIGFKADRLSPEEYGVLASKLLNRMEEVGSDGNPQIFTADNKMQKVITRQGNATLFEIRMRGKNRLYFWLTPENKQGQPEIVILGSHGGDESTQKTFINNYAYNRQKSA